MSILVTVGLIANSVVIGSPVWVFFIQSPVLFTFMGRSKFIPPMMKLTKVLFRWTLPIAGGITLSASLLRGCGMPSSWSTPLAALSLAATLINSLLIVPRALAAGAKATSKKTDTSSSKSKTDFAVSGGDGSTEGSVTKTLHQTVVLFVAIMLIGAVGHLHMTIQEQCN
jgi:hypothetical protein